MKKDHHQALWRYLLFCLLSVMLTQSCRTEPDIDRDGVSDDKDKCVEKKGPKPDGCPLPPKIGKINLYVETSASMGGYFAGASEFKTIISDLAVKVDKEISHVSIHFIADTIRNYQATATRFSSDIATTKIAMARSSELHHIFDKIAKNTSNSDISILVSDCILSFPNAAVKANPEINKQSASGTLKNNIYSTFVDLKKRGQSASLYAFSSKFFGRYYTYQNVDLKLKGQIRPFYIWIVGKKDVLPVFDAKLSLIPNFHPEQTLHFGALEEKIDHYRILTQLDKNSPYKLIGGSKASSDLGIEELDLSEGKSARFSAVVDLTALPPYARSIKYLRENLKLTAKGCDANFEVALRPFVALKNKKQMAYLEQCSHLFRVTVSSLRLDMASVQLTLPLKYDKWYQQWSTMDDKNIAKLEKKTFAFEHLVEGAKEAYNNADKNFIDLKFQINRK